MSQATSDYPADTGQSLDAWLDEWAVMEKARIARQQVVTLNMEGWRIRTIEQQAHIWAPDNMVATCIKNMKEARHAKTG